MAGKNPDIIIYGGGIAGLWMLARLRQMGYDALLLEKNALGGGQSIASQGILHSGVKYALAGKISKLAKAISEMPEIWRGALKGKGPVDLSGAVIASERQYLLIPKGITGGVTKSLTQKALGKSVKEIPPKKWPQNIKDNGFTGTLIDMQELVLDIPSVIKALAEPYKNYIRKGDEKSKITAKAYIYSCAAGNHDIAKDQKHDKDLQTQKRPLVMGMMRNAPFEVFAHLVGPSEKPVATITTHKDKDGNLIWYIGGQAAERVIDSKPEDTYKAARKAFTRYFPALDTSGMEWGSLAIDRVEGRSQKDGWLPDAPCIHQSDNAYYCWPTKLTFAPLLADMMIERLEKDGITPSHTQSTWNDMPEAPFADPPWNTVTWKKDSSEKQE